MKGEKPEVVRGSRNASRDLGHKSADAERLCYSSTRSLPYARVSAGKSSTNPRLHLLDHLDSSSFGFAAVLGFQMLQAPERMIVGNQHGLDSQRVGGNH